MHETVIKGVTIGIVSGLFVWWLTSKRGPYGASKYNPTGGGGTCADCQCNGLPAPDTVTAPLAADYLDSAPRHEPAISGINLGISINTNCGLDANVYANRMRSSTELGVGRNVAANRPVRVANPFSCNPCYPGSVCCGEAI